jgi:UDP-N-acetylglucosamine acyltransferase
LRPVRPNVSQLAAVSSHARLGDGCKVGDFAVVEDDVVLGDGTVVHPHAMVRAGTRMGRRNVVHPFAVLGGSPQDRRHEGGVSLLVVGDDNVFREHVTIHRGTSHGGGITRIGAGGLFMAAAHVAHDCTVADGVTLANATLLGGHVAVEDHVVTGGHVAVAPFARIGERAFLAGGAMVERDVPPFVIVAGDRARVRALNVVGLERAGVPAESRAALQAAFRRLFRGEEPRAQAAAALADHPDPLVRRLASALLRRQSST